MFLLLKPAPVGNIIDGERQVQGVLKDKRGIAQ